MDELESQQVCRPTDRRRIPQQVRAANRIEAIPEQLVHNQSSRHSESISDRNISLAGSKVQYVVGADDFEGAAGIGVAPLPKARHEPAARKRVRR